MSRSSGLHFFGLRLLGVAAFFVLAQVSFAAPPDYVREALKKFSADIPAGWAFTMVTQRENVSAEERFDPSQPLSSRWTLVNSNGQPPKESDSAKYVRMKAANPAPISQGTFKNSDVDPGTLKQVSEDEERAIFTGKFREISTETDKMLGHLTLELVVNKKAAYIEKYVLTLIEPYSPVLGVKMNSLTAQMTFVIPAENAPPMPAEFRSNFTGRIFFVGTEEKLTVNYSNYVRVN